MSLRLTAAVTPDGVGLYPLSAIITADQADKLLRTKVRSKANYPRKPSLIVARTAAWTAVVLCWA
ncbi:MAG: hypothetical protein R3C24_07745 [Cyanobacteriota/Melainabacteria group bacterium]